MPSEVLRSEDSRLVFRWGCVNTTRYPATRKLLRICKVSVDRLIDRDNEVGVTFQTGIGPAYPVSASSSLCN